MNERIKELAKEAGYKPLPGFDFANSLEETYLKKFAELIVQDCVSEVALMGVTNFENEDISWACRVIIDNIKNRFGV